MKKRRSGRYEKKSEPTRISSKDFENTEYGRVFLANMYQGDERADTMTVLVKQAYKLQCAINANDRLFGEPFSRETQACPEDLAHNLEELSKTLWKLIRMSGIYSIVVFGHDFIYPYCVEPIRIPEDWTKKYNDFASLFGYVLRYARNPIPSTCIELVERVAYLAWHARQIDAFNKAMGEENPDRIAIVQNNA